MVRTAEVVARWAAEILGGPVIEIPGGFTARLLVRRCVLAEVICRAVVQLHDYREQRYKYYDYADPTGLRRLEAELCLLRSTSRLGYGSGPGSSGPYRGP